jgi:hypothetical protein
MGGRITFRRIPSWENVLSRLRSGEYTQHFDGGMCKYVDNTTNSYDVLGVIDDLSNADWELLTGHEFLSDDDGETLKPSHTFVYTLELDTLVTDEDLEGTNYGQSFLYWNESIVENPNLADRMDLLIYLNDMLMWDFPRIADEIERLGWNE